MQCIAHDWLSPPMIHTSTLSPFCFLPSPTSFRGQLFPPSTNDMLPIQPPTFSYQHILFLCYYQPMGKYTRQRGMEWSGSICTFYCGSPNSSYVPTRSTWELTDSFLMFGATAGNEVIKFDQDERYGNSTINEARQEGQMEQIFIAR